MILEIKKYPDPILRKKSLSVSEINQSVLELMDNMVETMLAAPGVGLAAPQVGILQRIIVVNLSANSEDFDVRKFINPVILDMVGSVAGEEGCLSVPGEYGVVKRAEKIRLNALNENGDEIDLELEGLPARIIQHEVDHLDGILFVDKLPVFKRDAIKKHIKKRVAAGDY
jgi:peptide deformylase